MKIKSKVLAIGAGVALAVGVVAQPAAAATISYAYGTPVNWAAYVSSSLAPTIAGGQGAVQGGDFGGVSVTMRVQTYSSYPGFNIVSSASGGAITTVTDTHQLYTNLYHRCGWTFAYDIGGPFDVDCAYYSS